MPQAGREQSRRSASPTGSHRRAAASFSKNSGLRRLLSIVTAVGIAATTGSGLAMADDADKTPSTQADASATPSAEPTWNVTPTEKAGESSAASSESASASPSTPATSSATATPSASPSAKAATGKAATSKSEESSASAEAQDSGVSVQSVPAAGGNNAVITVKTGGLRTSQSAVGSLAGVELGFYAKKTGGSALFTCTSDADGDCSVTIPNTQAGPLGNSWGAGTNYHKQYWVRQTGVPSGYFSNANLGTGVTVTSDNYAFRTPAVSAGNTYRSTNDFMVATGNTNDQASGGIWQQSKNNPAFPAKCGINVGLVMDLSNSLSSTDVANLKKAGGTFVDALQGTPSSVGTFTFGTAAPASDGGNSTLPLTNVSTSAGATTVKNKINAMAAPGGNAGGTNWDRGLYQVAQSSDRFDVVVVITDGNPTFYANAEGPGNRTRFREVENGIFSANAIKAKDTRVVAVGVGSGVNSSASGMNLRSISGPSLNSDYYQSSSYDAAGKALRELALGNCQGSVSVVKQVIPEGGSVAQAVPAGGWTFTGTSTAGGVGVDGTAAKQTAADTGAVNFPLTFSGGTTSGSVTFAETQKSGYTLAQQGGKNAVCKRVDTGASVTSSNSGDLGFTVTANREYPISCTVYNQAPNTQATVSVAKKWVVNGTEYANGDQPDDLSAVPTLDGATKSFGTTYTGYTKGDSVAIGEKLTNGLTQCTVDAQKLTEANGSTVSQNLPRTVTLAGGDNRYTLTNTLTCKSTLTLTKKVEGGSAQPSAWTLDAVAPSEALAGPHGATGSSAASDVDVTPGVTYPLAESSGPLEYVQKVAPGAEPISGSTGSWYCNELDASGKVIPGFADGLNGGVKVPFGSRVTCEAVNQTAELTLVKQVHNEYGGIATADKFDLKATPSGDVPSGLDAQSVSGSTSGKTISVRPGTTYDLSESHLDGYTQDSLKCSIDGDDAESIDHVKLDAGQDASCVFVNVDEPGTVTWSKVDDGGHPIKGSEWKITGPQGTGSDLAVTDCVAQNANSCTGDDKNPAAGKFEVTGLKWGKYTLTETKAPAGYHLDPTAHAFQIKADALEYEFTAAFENAQATPPTLPLTGGTGRDIFFLAGGGLLVAGAVGGTVYGVRRKRHVDG